MNNDRINLILIFGFTTLAALLLIGRAFGYQWSGGEGVVDTLEIDPVAIQGDIKVVKKDVVKTLTPDDKLKRGEVIKTGQDSKMILNLEDRAVVGMHQNTDLRLDKISEGNISLKLERGRMVVSKKQNTEVKITTNYLTMKPTAQNFTVINFDFLETVQVVPFDGSVDMKHRNGWTKTIRESTKIKEVPPIEQKYEKFEINDNVAVEFYRWFNKKNPLAKQ